MKLITLHTNDFYKDYKLDGFANNILNLQANNIQYKAYSHDKSGFVLIDLKISALLSVLKTYDLDEIMCYLDGYDTLILEKDLTKIEKKFLDFNCDILFASEHKLAPEKNFTNLEKKATFFNYFSVDNCLNSGGIIFKNSKLIEFLEILDALDIKAMEDNDQYLWQMIYVFTQKFNVSIKLDENNEIFQCLSSYKSEEVGPHYGDNLFYNKRTNTYPYILHGQGMDGYRKLMQFSMKSNRYWTDLLNQNENLLLKNNFFSIYLESLKSTLLNKILTLKIYRSGLLKYQKDVILLDNNQILHLDDFHKNEYYYLLGLNHLFILDKERNITSLYDISSYKKNNFSFNTEEISGYFYWDVQHSRKLWLPNENFTPHQIPSIYLGPARS